MLWKDDAASTQDPWVKQHDEANTWDPRNETNWAEPESTVLDSAGSNPFSPNCSSLSAGLNPELVAESSYL